MYVMHLHIYARCLKLDTPSLYQHMPLLSLITSKHKHTQDRDIGETVHESLAIIIHLALSFPNSTLLPM